MFGMKQVMGGDWLGLWHAFQAPLVGFAVASVLALVGRWRGGAVVLVCAGGAGVLVGWVLLAGGVGAAWAPGARDMAARLPLLALAAFLLAGLTAWLAPSRGRWPCLLLLALGSGWWLAGAPHTMAEAMKVVLLACGLAAWHGLAARELSRGSPGRLVLAAWTLVLALWVVKAPPAWLLLAMGPALVSLVLLAVPVSELVLLPVALDLAAAMAATLVVAGRLPRGLGGLDVAVAAPVIALLLVPRLRFAAVLAGPLAAAVAIGAAWLAQWLLG